MIQLKNVSKSFGNLLVLQPTSLEVTPGRCTVLIGPSGCGKSTLLRLMIGLIEPDEGEVLFDGERLTSSNILACRRRMGYVIQDGGLFPHLSARENTSLLARHLGWGNGEANKRVDELAELTRLPKTALDRYPAQLSGGQRQRVGIMRALMLDPAVILLDEPMGALDPLVRYDLQEDLRGIFHSLKKTVVLVTHDMGEAGFFGDDVLLLGNGRIVQRGTLDDLIRTPADDFVAKFIRSQRLPELTAK
ncbi:Choline transport ATP-binding protein OpuBA [Anatilimnocola aggregata]|uniref:Choline transport ATP-binding protein OpuBA n=1 Tax=Anatilimnocola aggregata TaxID=2528021 RepID=A0A517Y5P0_9BACT|nr:ABC transporter ATP-binding protein [Anatilimnocola aggregata]QDU25559.1 Choline transport ATP-binding protein OpuBA [Anatilimnocola aggregata]